MTRPTALPLVRRSRRRRGGRLAVEPEHAQPAVHVAAVVQARDRLLARVAALRERDRALVQPRLRRKDAVVDLACPTRASRASIAQALELVGVQRRLDAGVEHLDRRLAVVARRDPGPSPPNTMPDVCCSARSRTSRRSARAAASCARARRAPARSAAGSRRSPRRQTPSGAITRPFARQQQRVARRRRPSVDVVRDHALEERLRVRAGDADVVARAVAASCVTIAHRD